eukprot:TRINITY_DN48835_c0_g1_i1.p1 TRINITY_DN48835_c0_g1~~TRINITY_DN48835_c0_g1_i1.p1  ORF type:complete len:329 (+),score=63.61 TRINITY_DN48835_c0_g1_i1:111-989(+)
MATSAASRLICAMCALASVIALVLASSWSQTAWVITGHHAKQPSNALRTTAATAPAVVAAAASPAASSAATSAMIGFVALSAVSLASTLLRRKSGNRSKARVTATKTIVRLQPLEAPVMISASQICGQVIPAPAVAKAEETISAAIRAVAVAPPVSVASGASVRAVEEDLLGLTLAASALEAPATFSFAGETTKSANGSRRKQRQQRYSDRNSRRRTGARLMRPRQSLSEPSFVSFEPSKVRMKIQSGLSIQANLKSAARREQQLPDSSSAGKSMNSVNVSQLFVTISRLYK